MSGEWITVSSFFPPPAPEPAFEELVAAEQSRWERTAGGTGLVPAAHVRVQRGNEEIAVQISPDLDAAFTPEQPLWKAD